MDTTQTHYTQESGQFHLHDLVPTKDAKGKLAVDEHGEIVREMQLVHSSAEVAFAYCTVEDEPAVEATETEPAKPAKTHLHVFTHGTVDGMKKWVTLHNMHSPHQASLKVFGQDTDAETVTRAIADVQFFATLL